MNVHNEKQGENQLLQLPENCHVPHFCGVTIQIASLCADRFAEHDDINISCHVFHAAML